MLNVIAYWITYNWERLSIVIKFAELLGGKSSEAILEVIYVSFRKNYKKVIEKQTLEGVVITIELAVGLDIEHKMLAVTKDNASNNNTFCNAFLTQLKKISIKMTLYTLLASYVVDSIDEIVELGV
jgi:hypothetical protein